MADDAQTGSRRNLLRHASRCFWSSMYRVSKNRYAPIHIAVYELSIPSLIWTDTAVADRLVAFRSRAHVDVPLLCGQQHLMELHQPASMAIAPDSIADVSLVSAHCDDTLAPRCI